MQFIYAGSSTDKSGFSWLDRTWFLFSWDKLFYDSLYVHVNRFVHIDKVQQRYIEFRLSFPLYTARFANRINSNGVEMTINLLVPSLALGNEHISFNSFRHIIGHDSFTSCPVIISAMLCTSMFVRTLEGRSRGLTHVNKWGMTSATRVTWMSLWNYFMCHH